VLAGPPARAARAAKAVLAAGGAHGPRARAAAGSCARRAPPAARAPAVLSRAACAAPDDATLPLSAALGALGPPRGGDCSRTVLALFDGLAQLRASPPPPRPRRACCGD